MNEVRISLHDATIRFRMSYHRSRTLLTLVSEMGRRLVGSWQPDYFTALDGITFEARSGDVIGVLGRNGSGKSTLLRTISGIYHPDRGSVGVNGRISALLSLGTGFNTTLSGRENIYLGGLTLGYSLSEIRERLPLILEFAEIGDFVDVSMRYYSSGMIARLSFAMVVTMEPDILLIDETLSVGDLGFQSKSQKAMKDLLKRASCQMIVSHSTETIRQLCNRAILIDRGRLIADGGVDEVIERYQAICGTRTEELPVGPADMIAWSA